MKVPLLADDLAAGDIMLRLRLPGGDNTIFTHVIAKAQKLLGGSNPNVTHAGVMSDKIHMIEALSGGLTASNIRVQNKRTPYAVFRCNAPNIARGAGTAAQMLRDIHRQGKKTRRGRGVFSYNWFGAPKSLFGSGSGRAKNADQFDDLLEKVLSGRGNNPLICSQFVAFVYQMVAVQNGLPGDTYIKGRDAKVTPSRLTALLNNSAHFTLVGYMASNIRD
ncbi:MAG: hypothetical protein AAGA03_03020 [Planctomycetota bacterium]